MSDGFSKPLLQIRGLGVDYGRGRRRATALDEVDLDLAAGRTVGLVGESGSGKTTLGKAVLGRVRPDRGSIVFDGQDITHVTGRARRPLATRIQVVFQNPYLALNPQRTVAQSVAETLTTRTDVSDDEVRSRVLESLEHVGIARSAADRFPASFSGGQRQRIAIARALLPRPDLVVCDEAVSALDLSIQAQVLNLLVELQDELGMAYLFITHDLAVVRHLCHDIVVLKDGGVVEHGRTAEVCAAPTQAYTRKLLDSAPVADPDLQRATRAS